MSESIVHCWEHGPVVKSWEHPGNMVSTTCMLPDGHDGEHETVPNDEIVFPKRPVAK